MLSRRDLIHKAAAGLVLASALPLLEACSVAPKATPAPSMASSGVKGNAVFPTFRPATNGPKPDFGSDGPQYEDGFSNYPADNPKSWTNAPPGSGAT